MPAAGSHTGVGFGFAAAFVDVADEREDVPQPTSARPVSSPTITRAAWPDVIGLLRDARGVSPAPCSFIEVSPIPVQFAGSRRRSRYARTLAREPQTDIAHQLLAWLRLWS